jgi:hypothetical protein
LNNILLGHHQYRVSLLSRAYRCGSAVVLLLLSTNAYADSVSVSYGQLEQEVTLQDSTVSLNPAGAALSLSVDFATNWQVSLDLQQWDDDEITQRQNDAMVDVDLRTLGGSLAYYLDNWSFSTRYGVSQDDTFISSVTHPNVFRRDDSRSTSFGGSAAYGWASDNWFYNVSGGVQYSRWDLDSEITTSQGQNPPQPPGQNQPSGPPQQDLQMQRTSGNSTSLNASVSIARFWSLTDNTGVLVGGLLSWNNVIDGDVVQITQNRQNQNAGGNNGGPGNANQGGNNGTLRSLSGDDNYGQLAMYISYDLTPSWSVDLDVGVDIGSEYSATSWSLSLGYFF